MFFVFTVIKQTECDAEVHQRDTNYCREFWRKRSIRVLVFQLVSQAQNFWKAIIMNDGKARQLEQCNCPLFFGVKWDFPKPTHEQLWKFAEMPWIHLQSQYFSAMATTWAPQHPSPPHPLVLLWPPLDFEAVNQDLSCTLEQTWNSWTVNVQCSHNDLERQPAVHDACAGTNSCFMWGKMAVLCGVLKSQRCVLVSHSLIWKAHTPHHQ